MAHHKSAIKRIRRNEKSRLRNRAKKTAFRNLERKFLAAKGEEAAKAGQELISYSDRMVRQGIFHFKKAARVKSSVHRKLGAGAKAA